MRNRGVYVRWHAFEFLLGWRGRIAGVLLLEPLKQQITLYCSAYCEELMEVVKTSLKEAGLNGELVVRSSSGDQ